MDYVLHNRFSIHWVKADLRQQMTARQIIGDLSKVNLIFTWKKKRQTRLDKFNSVKIVGKYNLHESIQATIKGPFSSRLSSFDSRPSTAVGNRRQPLTTAGSRQQLSTTAGSCGQLSANVDNCRRLSTVESDTCKYRTCCLQLTKLKTTKNLLSGYSYLCPPGWSCMHANVSAGKSWRKQW